MSREIKFRMWSGKAKKYFYDSDNVYGCLQNSKVKEWAKDYEDMVWQQFTGMLDKNGKEIYEGDVINFAYTPDNTFTGDVRWFDDRGAFGVVTGNAFELLEGLLDYWEYVEVIGNIFEN